MKYISIMNFTSSSGKKYYRGTVINNSEYCKSLNKSMTINII